MKKHYDFSKAQRGILYCPPESLRIPIYLDDDVRKKLLKSKRPANDVSKLVNSILRSQIDLADMLK